MVSVCFCVVSILWFPWFPWFPLASGFWGRWAGPGPAGLHPPDRTRRDAEGQATTRKASPPDDVLGLLVPRLRQICFSPRGAVGDLTSDGSSAGDGSDVYARSLASTLRPINLPGRETEEAGWAWGLGGNRGNQNMETTQKQTETMETGEL